MEQERTCYRNAEVDLLLQSDLQHLVKGGFLNQDFADGDFLQALCLSNTEEIFSNLMVHDSNIQEALKTTVNSWLNEDCSLDRQFRVLSAGAAALLAFYQDNWTGPSLRNSIPWLSSKFPSVEDMQSSVIACLVLDGESLFSMVSHPELLLLARILLSADLPDLKSSVLWKFRCISVHQQILEERSPQLHGELFGLAELLQHQEELTKFIDLNILIHLEIAQMFLLYHEVQLSSQTLESALKAAEVCIDLIGALGKRTHFQSKDVSQLTLKVNANEQQGITSRCPIKNIPKDVALNDDVLLNKITFSNPSDESRTELSPLQQGCVLGMFVQTQKTQPKDKLADEELMAYISFLLSQPRVWSIQFSSLRFRCKIESNHSRTVERSMMQAQELVSLVEAELPKPWVRLQLAFCAHLRPHWHLEEDLAGMLINLGCINSALDIYLKLRSWESVIACYNHLKLRHKAEEIIRQELAKKESVKLWCLLGDATDDVECYEKAWALSGERSARAQKHWGLHFLNRKQYTDAIPHLQESLSHNSLQVSLWFQLGYAALQVEDWTTAAKAYRRYCALDPENFEAWNNLAKAYVKQGQKNRAWKALQEALKWNFENWRVWDNFMVVSLDCAVMEEVIRAYHRVLDLKEKHVDIEVLDILVKAIRENVPDSDGLPCDRHSDKALKLFGRLTAQVTSNARVWLLYARLSVGVQAVHRLQRAHRCAVADGSWSRDVRTCLEVQDLSMELANESLGFAQKNPSSQESSSALSSAKLALKSVLAKVKQDRLNLLTGEVDDELLPQLKELENILEEILKVS